MSEVNMNNSEVIDALDEVVYICSIQSHELIYINKHGRNLLGIKDDSYIGKKCYKLIQGYNQPCKFCKNHLLSETTYTSWEHTNSLCNRHFIIKEKLVKWDNQLAKMQLAMDFTKQNNVNNIVKRKLEIEESIVECISCLLEQKNIDNAMMTVLDYVLKYYDGDRAYVFEFDWENALANNTYEKCKNSVEPQKNNLQHIPNFILHRWINEFNKNNAVIIPVLEDIKYLYPNEYKDLVCQNIQSLIAVPFKINNEIVGFLGVDNPSDLSKGQDFLCSLSYFIINQLTKHRMHNELKYLSYHDSLTGVYNRTKFNEYSSNFDPNNIKSLGVIFTDINGLKQINDTYGHQYGDAIIVSMTSLIKDIFESHKIFRLSGDEFIIICENVTKDNFIASIKQLKSSILNNGVTDMSIGHVWSRSEINLFKMICDADEFMYLNKQKFYKNNLMNQNPHAPLFLKSLLLSLKNKEFVMFLQPKMDLTTGEICGAEALVRHNHPKQGIIPPSQFIPMLEKEKTIHYIDFFILDESCKLIRKWIELGMNPFKISLNFSRITLMEDDLVKRVVNICDKYNVPKHLIEIEVTETVGEIEREHIASISYDLKKAGFGLSLDDFGTKYSSLDMMALLDLDLLKIDRSLVSNIAKSDKSKILIKNIINICHDMSIECLAEGVEDQEQLDILKEMNCDYIQGYILNKPISLQNFEKIYI